MVVESTSLVLTSGDRLKEFHRIVTCSGCRCEFPGAASIDSRAQLQGLLPAALCDRCAALEAPPAEAAHRPGSEHSVASVPPLSEADVPAPPTPSTGRSEDGLDQGTEPESDSGSPEEVGPDEGRPPVVEMDGAGSPGARQQEHEPDETGPVFDADRWFREVEERVKERCEQDPTRPE